MNAILLVTQILAGVFLQANSGTPKSIACAVMPMNQVEIASAVKHRQYADYKGRRYFFCCGVCPAAFKGDPAKFSSRPSIPIPKK